MGLYFHLYACRDPLNIVFRRNLQAKFGTFSLLAADTERKFLCRVNLCKHLFYSFSRHNINYLSGALVTDSQKVQENKTCCGERPSIRSLSGFAAKFLLASPASASRAAAILSCCSSSRLKPKLECAESVFHSLTCLPACFTLSVVQRGSCGYSSRRSTFTQVGSLLSISPARPWLEFLF